MADHPGIVFRDGPSGRRAGLAAGPDVWEVIAAMHDTPASGEDAIADAAEWLDLSAAQIRIAIRYYGEFRDEVDERIKSNRDEAERQRAAWKRAQDALG
jgi:hypothetical protein